MSPFCAFALHRIGEQATGISVRHGDADTQNSMLMDWVKWCRLQEMGHRRFYPIKTVK